MASPQSSSQSPRPLLADAFSALLAAEQGKPIQSSAPVLTAQAPVASDDLVEQVTRRVLERLTERLSDRVMRDAIADSVSKAIERVVREELERMK